MPNSAISSEGKVLIEPFKFTNDYDGFYLLLSKLAPLDQNSIIIGLESTAHYGDNLVRFLISKDFKVNFVKNNATFKAYYAAKRAEDRTHYNALGHCAGKLCQSHLEDAHGRSRI